LAARVVQHELDHLDVILFPHRVPGQEFGVAVRLVLMRGVDGLRIGLRQQWVNFVTRDSAH
jgi:hypothetical protein